jgi:hypothetical protein
MLYGSNEQNKQSINQSINPVQILQTHGTNTAGITANVIANDFLKK